MSELSALIDLYNTLVDQHRLSAPGYSKQKVSYAIDLEPGTGKFNGLISVKEEAVVRAKTVYNAAQIDLPTPVGNRCGRKIAPRFLWDNAVYFFGFPQEGKPIERSEAAFKSAAKYHHEILDGMDDPISTAILNFFDSWDYKNATSEPLLAPYMDDLLGGCNMVFCVGGVMAHDEPKLRQLWQLKYDSDEDDVVMPCLYSGKEEPIARTHPKIKGVRGGQSTGTSLVSFNFDAACHYGKDQSYNAPLSKYAAFAYTAALNYLLSERKGVNMVKNTTVVCWSENAEDIYQQFASAVLFGGEVPEGMTEEDVIVSVRRLADGEPCEAFSLYPNRKFYVLGIDPNAGRLAIRFFMENNFGAYMRNVSKHLDRLEIDHHPDARPIRTVYQILTETTWKSTNRSNKTPEFSPVLAGALTSSIINGAKYPASLPVNMIRRISAEREVPYGKAAVLKAYYLNNPHPDCPVEICTPSLNEDSTYIPYVLGRLFYMYENLYVTLKKIQNPKATPYPSIRKKYLSSAAAMPDHVFGVVLNKMGPIYLKSLSTKGDSGKHLSFWYKKQIEALLDIIGINYPIRMNLPQQAAFYLGYYHQKEDRFKKKDETAKEEADAAEEAAS